MSVDLQTASQELKCNGCKQIFPTEQISPRYGAADQKFNLCQTCVKKIGTCDLCKQRIVTFNDKAINGSVQIDVQTDTIFLCQACAKQLPCVACTKPIFTNKKTSDRPRMLLKDNTFLCGLCAALADICGKCDDAIVLLNGKPYKNPVQAAQIQGTSVWHCAQCGANEQFLAKCVCGTLLFANGQKKVDYEPEKINGRIYICNVCGKGERMLCDGCGETIVAIKLEKETYPIEMSQTYEYSGLTMCLGCLRGSKTCICFAPVAISQGQALKVLKGAKVYVDKTWGNDYRCKYCNTPPFLDQEPDELYNLKEALYKKVYTWFITPGTGLGLPLSKKPDCMMVNTYSLTQYGADESSSAVNGYYDTESGDIFIARAITPVRFISTLAHELTHCWQHQQGLVGKQSGKIREGFAEWVACTCLATMPYNYSWRDETEILCLIEMMKKNPSPDYSQGLKHFLKIEGPQKDRKAVMEEAMRKVEVKKQ